MSAPEIVEEWIRYANNDLIVAKHCFENLHPKQTEIASFHCQQCAEKSLKAFLVYKDIEPPKIHDLKQLCKMCQDIDGSFAEIARPSARLSLYSVTPRYPEELAPDENMVKIALNEAQQVYDFCVGKAKDTQQENGG